MQLFYLPDDPGPIIELPREEARHLLKSLRYKLGDEVQVTNGRGAVWHCRISADDLQRCELTVIRKEIHSLPQAKFHLAIAPTKQTDRLEWCLEKCVEMGISRFTPLITSRTERVKLKTDRLERIVVSAMKQSGQFFLPLIDQPIEIKNFLKSPDLAPQRLIAHLMEHERKELGQIQRPGDCLMLIGPEGDFDAAELKLALNAGFVPVSLGKNRLRTETAGIFTCAHFHFINPEP